MSAAARVWSRRGLGIACLAVHVLVGLLYAVHWDAERIWIPFTFAIVPGLAALPIAILCFHRVVGRVWVSVLLLLLFVLISDADEGYISRALPSTLLVPYLSWASRIAFMTASGIALLRRDMGLRTLAVLSVVLPWWVAGHWYASGDLVASMIEFRHTGEPRYHAHLWTVGNVIGWLVWAGLASVCWHSAVVAFRELTGRPPPWSGGGNSGQATAAVPRPAAPTDGRGSG